MERSYLSPNLDSLDADNGLWHLLNSHGEVEGVWEPQSLEQHHHHKHLAGCNQVVMAIIGDEGDNYHDFADSKKWCQIHSSKVGTFQNLGNFLPRKDRRK